MTTRPLHWQDITQDPLVVRIKDAGAEAIAKTPLWQKRWNSLTAAAQVVLQLANIAALLLTDVHWGVSLAIAIVVGLAEVIMQARTKTPVTEGVVAQLTAEAEYQAMRERLAESLAQEVRRPDPAPAQPDPVVIPPGFLPDRPFFDRD